jgi:hypothetical protein
MTYTLLAAPRAVTRHKPHAPPLPPNLPSRESWTNVESREVSDCALRSSVCPVNLVLSVKHRNQKKTYKTEGEHVIPV